MPAARVDILHHIVCTPGYSMSPRGPTISRLTSKNTRSRRRLAVCRRVSVCIDPARGNWNECPQSRRWPRRVRAIDPATGERKWEFAMQDVIDAGILTTASDLLFSGGREGYFSAVGRYQWKAPVEVRAGRCSGLGADELLSQWPSIRCRIGWQLSVRLRIALASQVRSQQHAVTVLPIAAG